jgi:hypothetical protein
MALLGDGQQGRKEGDDSVERRFRWQGGVVEVEDMPLMTVDQRREFNRQSVRVSPGLGFGLTPQGATVFQKDVGRRVIGSSEGDSNPIDDAAFAFMNDFRRKSLIRAFDEESGQPVGHVGGWTGLHIVQNGLIMGDEDRVVKKVQESIPMVKLNLFIP